jgi:hypothetical protein
MRCVRFAALTLAVAGCMEFDQQPADTYKTPFSSTRPPALAPAATDVAARVDIVGRRIVAANPQIGAKPMFATIGAPEPEVFHRGTSDVYVTEGLVKQCSTDGQLAAILCSELGKVVAEREALSPPQTRRPERTPPADVPIGNAGNPADASDLTRLREVADYDEDRKRRNQPVPPPDPAVLTRTYLLRAGYHDDDLAAAGPLLLAAQSNATFEKQMRAPAAGSAPALGAPLPTTPPAPGGF